VVRAFHAAALAAGYEDHGAPGERSVYHPGYYAAGVGRLKLSRLRPTSGVSAPNVVRGRASRSDGIGKFSNRVDLSARRTERI
jgi:hypothetical protein